MQILLYTVHCCAYWFKYFHPLHSVQIVQCSVNSWVCCPAQCKWGREGVRRRHNRGWHRTTLQKEPFTAVVMFIIIIWCTFFGQDSLGSCAQLPMSCHHHYPPLQCTNPTDPPLGTISPFWWQMWEFRCIVLCTKVTSGAAQMWTCGERALHKCENRPNGCKRGEMELCWICFFSHGRQKVGTKFQFKQRLTNVMSDLCRMMTVYCCSQLFVMP